MVSEAGGRVEPESRDTAVSWFVYILCCRSGDLYTGATADLERRLREHQAGKGGRFTKAMRPVELVYYEEDLTESDAKRREAQIKTWSRIKKLALIAGEPLALKRA